MYEWSRLQVINGTRSCSVKAVYNAGFFIQVNGAVMVDVRSLFYVPVMQR